MKKFLTLLLISFCVSISRAQTVGTYGDVTVVLGPDNQPAWQLTSSATGDGYAGVYLGFDVPIATSALTDLSAVYVMTSGTFYGGAPRFTLEDSTGNYPNDTAFLYWGTPVAGAFVDPNLAQTTYASTGNYANTSSTDARVQGNGFGGYNPGYKLETWSQFLGEPGVSGTMIQYIDIDLDASFAVDQTMLLKSFTVNGVTYTPASPVPEPATWSMLGLGVALLASIQRFRRKG